MRPDPSLPLPALGQNPDEYAAWLREKASAPNIASINELQKHVLAGTHQPLLQDNLVRFVVTAFYGWDVCEAWLQACSRCWGIPFKELLDKALPLRREFCIQQLRLKRQVCLSEMRTGFFEEGSEAYDRLRTDYEAAGFQLAGLGVFDLEPAVKPAAKGKSQLMDEAREKGVTIKDILTHYGVKTRGSKAVCPFHDDHDPSLSFNAEVWKCWGCGAKGNVLTLIDALEAQYG